MARFPRGVPLGQGHGSRRQFRRNPDSISPGLRALSRHVAPCINPELGINMAAETRNGAARLRVTEAGGAIRNVGTLARARAVAHIHPLKAVRCANRATWRGVTGSGNNIPRGGPPACAAGAARPRPVMPRIATGAPGAWPNAQEKRRKMQEAASATSSGEYEGFV